VCAVIPAIHSATRIVLLRHRAERGKTSNTARLVHLALPESVLLDHGMEDGPVDLGFLHEPGTWRLDAEAPPWRPGESPPRQLLVLDGSWTQVRRMVQRRTEIRRLPAFSLPAPRPRPRMRVSPPGRMSTLEAVAEALRVLEGAAAEAEALLRLYDCVAGLVAAGRPLHIPPSDQASHAQRSQPSSAEAIHSAHPNIARR
jgi:DTW domain-containing protein YfiP